MWIQYRAIISGVIFACLVLGCRRESSRPEQESSGKSVSTAGLAPHRNSGPGAGAAGTPPFFPSSAKDGPWVQGEPVQAISPSELGKVMPAEEAKRLSYFGIDSITRGTYQLPHSSAVPIASLLVISAKTVDDAYGILTCRSESHELFRIGGETRVQRGSGLTLHCWQGKAYVAAQITQNDAEATEELIRLLTFVTGKIPGERMPALMDAVPRESSAPVRRWLVRHLASLPEELIAETGPFDPQRLSDVLGLGPDTLMCVAASGPSGTSRPNAVWAASYPSAKEANAAMKKYQRYLDANPRDSVVQSTNILPAQGVFLLGTWTAEEESMQYLLPRIMQLLPS